MVAMSLDDQERREAPPADVVEECDHQLALQLQELENRAASQEAPVASSPDLQQAASSPTGSSGSKKKDKVTKLSLIRLFLKRYGPPPIFILF